MVSNIGIEKVFPSLVPPGQPAVLPPNWAGAINIENNWHQKIITLTEYNELMRKAKAFDEATNQPDCPDPEKMAKMEEFCKKFETMGTEMFRLANELRNILK